MINLEIPKKFKPLATQANQVAKEVFRPISRKYDVAEHEYPKELDMLASLIDGMNEGSDMGGAGAAGVRRDDSADSGENRNGSNLSTVLGLVVFAGDRAEHLGGDLVCLARQRLELLRYLEVDHFGSFRSSGGA